MKKSILLFSLFGLLLIASCNKNNQHVPVCDGSTPTYDSEISTIISNKCLGCHGSGSSSGDYSTYSGLSAVTANGKFEKEVLTDQTMPQSGSLSEDQLNTIKCWVENGFPEN